MYALKLIARNALRHKLRTALTIVGLTVAIVAFGLLQTVVNAWYSGVDGSSASRIVVRNAISLVFSLPLSYRERIRGIEGVRLVSYSNWFGGVYKDPKYFFPQFAVDKDTYFDVYSDVMVPPDQLNAFKRDRRGAIVGRKLAEIHGFKVGDVVPIKGTIFPGTWEFTVRGIYTGKEAVTDETRFFFQWDYLNESLRARFPGRRDQVGVFVIDVDDPAKVAQVSQAIDNEFKNSLAETLSESERAFQLGFVAMTEAIVVAIRVVSFVVIVIILAVLANVMAMTARERLSEYATMKALGFSPGYVGMLIFGESVLIALAGGLIGVLLTFPIAKAFGQSMGTLFRTFNVSADTVAMQLGAALIIGLIAALFPTRRAASVKIVDGLRAIG